MRLVSELLDEAEKAKARGACWWMTSRGAQKLREQWVLGRFASLRKDRRLYYAVPQESPDFLCYDREKKRRTSVEVTECITPGRRRNAEYSKTAQLPDACPRPVKVHEITPELIREALDNKTRMRYPSPSILLVYINVRAFLNECEWLSTLASVAEQVCVAALPFDEVWLLNSSATALCQLTE